MPKPSKAPWWVRLLSKFKIVVGGYDEDFQEDVKLGIKFKGKF